MAVIRRERPTDEAAVRSIHCAAFDQGAGEPAEAGLLDGLRACEGWIPALSLVVEQHGGSVAGHAVCSRGHVGTVACLGLGPIAVDPARQGTGLGSALMHAVVGAAEAAGEPLIALLGNPDYYTRFGFVASSEVSIDAPDPQWGRFFQVRTLTAWNPSMTGLFRYAEPFQDLD